MNSPINVVVIGCSAMAQRHMNGVIDSSKAKLYGICDIHQEILDEALKTFTPENAPENSTTNWKDFVDDPQVDAAVIVTPDKLHLPMVEAFLRAGKAVMCEKPMALNVAECKKMMEVEKEVNGFLMIGQICRFTPAFIMAKEIIDAGRIGELMFVESEYAHNYEHARGVDDWRVDPDRHGFIGGACHAVDLLRWIAGNPTSVTSLSNHKSMLDWPVDDTTIAIYQFPNNVIGKVFGSIGPRRDYTMRSVFYGTKGTIICDNTSGILKLYTVDEPVKDGKPDYTVAQELPVAVRNHNAKDEISTFINAVAEGKTSPIPSQEGANTVTVCYATVQSSKEGRTVAIEYPVV